MGVFIAFKLNTQENFVKSEISFAFLDEEFLNYKIQNKHLANLYNNLSHFFFKKIKN